MRCMGTIRRYISEALKRAVTSGWGDGQFFASIPDFEGLGATGASIEDACNDLEGALESWIVAALTMSRIALPKLGDVTLCLERATES
jgi:predicted RNase H-like HicB family nuclease